MSYCPLGQYTGILFYSDETLNENEEDLNVAMSASDITFYYSTANGTAQDSVDYTAISGTAVIRAGETTATIVVPIINDFYAENTETFFVNLSDVSENTIIANGQGVGTILDNGAPDGTGPSESNNPDSLDTSNGYDSEDTVFLKLTTDATANKGDDLVHNIKLVDADGDDILLYDGESVTATLTYTPSAIKEQIQISTIQHKRL